MYSLKDIAVSIAGEDAAFVHRRLRGLVAARAIIPTITGKAPIGARFDKLEVARAQLAIALMGIGYPVMEIAWIVATTRSHEAEWRKAVALPWSYHFEILALHDSKGLIQNVAGFWPIGTRGDMAPSGFDAPSSQLLQDHELLATTTLRLEGIVHAR